MSNPIKPFAPNISPSLSSPSMASSTPPHCSITATKPAQNHHYPQAPRQRPCPQTHLSKFYRGTRNAVPASPTPLSQNPNFPSLSPIPPSRSELGHDFRGRRPTRAVSKFHFNRPKASPTPHTEAEEALQQALCYNIPLDSVLRSYESKLSVSDGYGYLLRELGNRGECSKAVQCFEFAVQRERRRNEQGKLASNMISILGRNGRVDLAMNVFDTANREGYGNTVYAFSALISAYGRNGQWEKALKVFESMKASGLKPNLVTYNAVIDACAKGGVEYRKAVEIFDEMGRIGVQPDRITYNSLLAVCSRGGLWEHAWNLFDEMVYRIEPDIFSYNTLLDALCKGSQMKLAFEIMEEMRKRKIWPNVVTYSTMIDGCAKVGKQEEALSLFDDMRSLGIGLDRVSYNTLLPIFASLGRFEDALGVCEVMEQSGIKKDVVTYNVLLKNYGKQGLFDEVNKLFMEMKEEKISPNLLTYSTLISVYSKGGLHKEAMESFKELKQAGLEADVVLYSDLIDTLCKNGLVESAVSLLDEMTEKGKPPNVVSYNSIIDAFGRSAAAHSQEGIANITNESGSKSSITALICVNESERKDEGKDDRVMKYFEQLKGHFSKDDTTGKSQELSCILGLFHMMHELRIKPNVVTFSAILNACSRCNSFEEASMLLEELRLFDNQVYGVAHGLLMGNKENVWFQAQSLFDEVKRMDSSTASAFYNALTDMLWHFGQKQGAQLVVIEGKRRHVWENAWCDSCLDLHLMSSGAAQAMVHAWLLNIRSIVYEGHELPKLLSILTGWGKHSKVVGDGTLRRVIAALLKKMGSPFYSNKSNIGRFSSPGALVAAWLKESGTLKVLILHDDRTHPETRGLNKHTDLQILPL